MSRLSKSVALLTLVLWGLASVHCRLESVPGFDFLKSCCLVEAGAPAPAPADCGTDGCGPVEKGNYGPQPPTKAMSQPPATLVMLLPRLSDLLPEAGGGSVRFLEPPAEIPRIWQFSHRTALPPRAPSLPS